MAYFPCCNSKINHLTALGVCVSSDFTPLINMTKVGINKFGSKFGDANAAVSAINGHLDKCLGLAPSRR